MRSPAFLWVTGTEDKERLRGSARKVVFPRMGNDVRGNAMGGKLELGLESGL